MKFILRAIAQVVPNKGGIQAPSRIEAPIERSSDTVEGCDTRRSMVSFESDGISNAKDTTTYMLPTTVTTESGGEDIWPVQYVITGKKKG